MEVLLHSRLVQSLPGHHALRTNHVPMRKPVHYINPNPHLCPASPVRQDNLVAKKPVQEVTLFSNSLAKAQLHPVNISMWRNLILRRADMLLLLEALCQVRCHLRHNHNLMWPHLQHRNQFHSHRVYLFTNQIFITI